MGSKITIPLFFLTIISIFIYLLECFKREK